MSFTKILSRNDYFGNKIVKTEIVNLFFKNHVMLWYIALRDVTLCIA